jgi:hypothetical protein
MPLVDTAVVRPSGRLVFSSDVQATFVLPAVAADVSLPSVVIPSGFLPDGARISRVIAGLAWRTQIDSSASANAVDGAQNIQVRSDAPGTWRNAINIADDALATGASATEGGMMLLGDNDLSVEVVGTDTYEFQWDEALVDGASLTLYDVQTYLVIDFV